MREGLSELVSGWRKGGGRKGVVNEGRKEGRNGGRLGGREGMDE